MNAPLFKRVSSERGEHLLVVPHSRIYDLPSDLAARFDAGDSEAIHLAEALAQTAAGEEPLEAIPEPEPQSISLNVSSACNLACTYCYADRGAFHGAQSATMEPATARAAIDRLFATADVTRPVTVGFLGGEPFVNRALIHDTVGYAARAGKARGLDVRFAVTTNATLLRPDDLALLREHPFAVTVSLDGGAAVQDAQRPTLGGKAELRSRAHPHRGAARESRAGADRRARDGDARQPRSRRCLRVDPRARLSRGRLCAAAILSVRQCAHLGGLAALSRRAAAAGAFGNPRRPERAGDRAEQSCDRPQATASRGKRTISRAARAAAISRSRRRDAGTPVTARSARSTTNSVTTTGSTATSAAHFSSERHVDAQADCRVCWARYLCSGGCHQEKAARDKPSCDFIRGWLEFCLRAYCDLIDGRPEYFAEHRVRVEELSA